MLQIVQLAQVCHQIMRIRPKLNSRTQEVKNGIEMVTNL